MYQNGASRFLPYPISAMNQIGDLISQESNTGDKAYDWLITNLGTISNGNRTGWSLIWWVIIRVTDNNYTSDWVTVCLITSIMTDRIGRHEVLLPINHNNKIWGKKVEIGGRRRPLKWQRPQMTWSLNRPTKMTWSVNCLTYGDNQSDSKILW